MKIFFLGESNNRINDCDVNDCDVNDCFIGTSCLEIENRIHDEEFGSRGICDTNGHDWNPAPPYWLPGSATHHRRNCTVCTSYMIQQHYAFTYAQLSSSWDHMKFCGACYWYDKVACSEFYIIYDYDYYPPGFPPYIIWICADCGYVYD